MLNQVSLSRLRVGRKEWRKAYWLTIFLCGLMNIFALAHVHAAKTRGDANAEEGLAVKTADKDSEYREARERLHGTFHYLETFSEAKPNKPKYLYDLQKTAWKNPSMTYQDLGLSKNELIALVGDGVVVLTQKLDRFKVPYRGRFLEWQNGFFSTTIMQVPLSAKAMRETIMRNDRQNQWKDYFPNLLKTAVMVEAGRDLMLREKYKIEISFFDINSESYSVTRLEDNGDITFLSLTGGGSVKIGLVPIVPKALLSPTRSASIGRWQFVDISESKSLLVRTSWSEVVENKKMEAFLKEYEGPVVDTNDIANNTPNNDAHKKSNKDFKSELYTLNTGFGPVFFDFRSKLKTKLGLQDEGSPSLPISTLANSPSVFNQLSPYAKRLSPLGPIYFIHPAKADNTKQTHDSLFYVTAMTIVRGKPAEVKSLSSQIDSTVAYVEVLDKSDKTPVNDKDFQIDFSATLAKNGVPFVPKFKMGSIVNYEWQNESCLAFEAVSGDVAKLKGQIEWQALDVRDKDQTLMSVTAAFNFGAKPKFPFNFIKDIAGAQAAGNLLASGGILLAQRQWIEWSLDHINPDANPCDACENPQARLDE